MPRRPAGERSPIKLAPGQHRVCHRHGVPNLSPSKRRHTRLLDPPQRRRQPMQLQRHLAIPIQQAPLRPQRPLNQPPGVRDPKPAKHMPHRPRHLRRKDPTQLRLNVITERPQPRRITKIRRDHHHRSPTTLTRKRQPLDRQQMRLTYTSHGFKRPKQPPRRAARPAPIEPVQRVARLPIRVHAPKPPRHKAPPATPRPRVHYPPHLAQPTSLTDQSQRPPLVRVGVRIPRLSGDTRPPLRISRNLISNSVHHSGSLPAQLYRLFPLRRAIPHHAPLPTPPRRILKQSRRDSSATPPEDSP